MSVGFMFLCIRNVFKYFKYIKIKDKVYIFFGILNVLLLVNFCLISVVIRKMYDSKLVIF